MSSDDWLRVQQQLAGLVSLQTGRLSGRFPPTSPPEVPLVLALEGDVLVWSMFSDEEPRRWPESPPDLEGALDRFIRIRDAAGVLGFAKRFGPLRLCEHGVPFSHSTYCQPTKREPVASWLGYAETARAVVAIASQMRRNRYASREDRDKLWAAWPQLQSGGSKREIFEELLSMSRLAEERGVHSPPYSQWLLMRPVIEWFVDVSGVRPGIPAGWQGETQCPVFELQGHGVLGALGVQLLAAVGGAHEIHLCQSCGEPYTPRRQPQRGRRHYCDRPQCKTYGARLRARDHRARGDRCPEPPRDKEDA
jgi:hypothetical protein